MLNPLIYVRYFEPRNTIILSILEIPEREREKSFRVHTSNGVKHVPCKHDQAFIPRAIVREICKLSFEEWQKCELITTVTTLYSLVRSAFTINEAISPSPSRSHAFCFSVEKLLGIEELWSKAEQAETESGGLELRREWKLSNRGCYYPQNTVVSYYIFQISLLTWNRWGAYVSMQFFFQAKF